MPDFGDASQIQSCSLPGSLIVTAGAALDIGPAGAACCGANPRAVGTPFCL
jgi:hypothetical protein